MNKIVFILLLHFNLYSQDYSNYHIQINKAEKYYFLQNNVDSCLYVYDKTFKEYNFIFLKDIVNASQIAFYSKRDYLKYIERGFEFGLKIEHLKQIDLYKPIYEKLLKDKKLKQIYLIKRKKYLSKIDVDYLDWAYNACINDQIDKLNENYESKKRKTFNIIKNKIIEKGFPGEKLIGIPDSLIFKELKSVKKDFYQRISKNSYINYLKLDEQILSNKFLTLVLIHNFCSYNLLENYWLNEIKKGNIHPRDVALFFDNTYRNNNCDSSINGVYKVNIFVKYEKILISREKINKKREKLFIVPLEVDEAKEKYEREHGFKLFWGFWNCR